MRVVCLEKEVIDTYGMTEFGLIASESGRGRGSYRTTSGVTVEVLDEQGHSVPSGQVGELVINSIIKHGHAAYCDIKTQDMGALRTQQEFG